MQTQSNGVDTVQLELLPIVPIHRQSSQSLDQQFQIFHTANPHIYRALRTLAIHMRNSGRNRYSIKGLFEVLRWRYSIQTSDPTTEYKLNNSYTSFYARLLNQEPELEGMFEMRTQRWHCHER
jgi:hypothetical protein